MARLKKSEVAAQLIADLKELSGELEYLKNLGETQLSTRPRPDAWSALECIEHLNQTYAIYLTNILAAQEVLTEKLDYRPTYLGKKAHKSMQPTPEGKRKFKMKTFKVLEPLAEEKSKEEILGSYETTLQSLKDHISKSLHWDWDKVKIVSAAGPVLKFKLGDAYRFMVSHDQRHMLQAKLALDAED